MSRVKSETVNPVLKQKHKSDIVYSSRFANPRMARAQSSTSDVNLNIMLNQ